MSHVSTEEIGNRHWAHDIYYTGHHRYSTDSPVTGNTWSQAGGSNSACPVADGAHDATVHMCLSRCEPICVVFCRCKHGLLESRRMYGVHAMTFAINRAATGATPRRPTDGGRTPQYSLTISCAPGQHFGGVTVPAAGYMARDKYFSTL
ncbi:hypothetical protein TgHK011_004375 [Trichoderma gracile]|nr:hypothetical protein TgHK011_004375 [Trichoderma gracile]